MKSKHCPYKNRCHSAGTCQSCDYGRAYERMAAKIRRLDKERKALRDQLRAAKEATGHAAPTD